MNEVIRQILRSLIFSEEPRDVPSSVVSTIRHLHSINARSSLAYRRNSVASIVHTSQ